jgi:uncharacterized protein YebE (UPF0316 family)
MTDYMTALQDLFNSSVFTWVILPILIFLARVTDVTLGTFRIIFTSRGKRTLAPIFGFIEVFIWIVAISQIMKNVNNIAAYLGYAAGFAAGTFIGLSLEEKMAIGTLIVRVIVKQDPSELVQQLHDAGYGVTFVDAHGVSGKVSLIYTIVKRKDLAEVVNIIHLHHPKAFLSIEEVRSTQEGIFPVQQHRSAFVNHFMLRKSK